MFVEDLLPGARERLVTIAEDAPLIEAARLLHAGTDILAVCRTTGVLAGIITKTDVVGQIGRCQGSSCTVPVALVMERDVLVCRSGERSRDVWEAMKGRGIKNVPLLDSGSMPLGVINARDLLQVILQESEDDEGMMRDYIMGFGYR
jgi:CBS domain-containing protein